METKVTDGGGVHNDRVVVGEVLYDGCVRRGGACVTSVLLNYVSVGVLVGYDELKC